MVDEKTLYAMRKSYNLRILDLLMKHLGKYPGMRLGQALYNLKVIELDKDPFYEEPNLAFDRVKRAYDKIEAENPSSDEQDGAQHVG